jgi:transposase
MKERVQMATILSAKLRQTPGLLDRIVFTDECILRAEDTKLYTLRRPGHAVDPIRAPKYSAKVHVWGAIGKGVKELIFINGNIDSEKYVDDVLKVFISEVNPTGKVLMQDGAPAHRSRYTTEFIRSQGLEILPWAAYSPDWNPIENLWSILKRRMNSSCEDKVEELMEIVEDAWDSIPESTINNLVNSFPGRLERTVEVGGEDCQL